MLFIKSEMRLYLSRFRRALTLIMLMYSYCFTFKIVAQNHRQELEKIERLEKTRSLLKKQQLNMQLDTAIQFSKQGFYADADKIFISLLAKLDKIPSRVVYYFGKNSFHLRKYAQSIDWLNKYVELKGATGKFSKSTLDYLKKAEKYLLLSKKNKDILTSRSIPIWSWDHKIPCEGRETDKIICPVCHGNTVIVTQTFLNKTYRACPYCSHKGYVNCEEYNKILEGKLDDKRYK